MKFSVSREILLLSLAFLFSFAGFGGVQQYVTTFFAHIGLPHVGFQSLILIYLFFVLSNPLSALVVSRLGFLIDKISYESSFFLAALLPLVGLLFIFQLKDLRSEKSENRFHLLRQAVMSKTMWRLSTIWFSAFFVFGLTIGIIPLEVKNTLGVSYIGSLSSLFYVMPVLLSYGLGRLSDVKGRKALLLIAFLISFLGLVSLYFSHDALPLIVGVILVALYFSIVSPMTLALVGDVSTKKNLEYLTSFFWMVQNVGVVSALILSTFIQTKIIYLISIAVLSLGLLIVFPLLKAGFQHVKQRIALEVG